MSFQHFRLQPLAPQPVGDPIGPVGLSVSPSSLSQALGQVPQSNVIPNSVHNFHLQPLQNGSKKGPYGSGDADDGYTLVFETMEAFQTWRRTEEEEKMVEFVKGDTHGSKAIPPRFKDHTKLVCARHSRSGRKKYVKKYPDRVRKVPSRKLEGQGCSASISYKTYFESDEVRACYVSEHSHEIGLANLPFTKRGRKAQADQQAARSKRARTAQAGHTDDPSVTPPPSPPPTGVSAPAPENAIAGPSSLPMQPNMQSQPSMPAENPPSQVALQRPQTFQSAISMIAPLPPPAPAPPPVNLAQDRWDRMGILFQSIRDHARSFEYPGPSVAALESVLIRLYLESPINGGMGLPQPGMNDAGMSGLQHMNGIRDSVGT